MSRRAASAVPRLIGTTTATHARAARSARSRANGSPSSPSRPTPAQGGDKHPLAGGPLEDERLVAVDPFSRTASDLDGRELVERDPEPIGSTRPVQDEVVVAEFETAAGSRAGASAPDNGVLVRTGANALGGQVCSFPLGQAIAPTASRVRPRTLRPGRGKGTDLVRAERPAGLLRASDDAGVREALPAKSSFGSA